VGGCGDHHQGQKKGYPISKMVEDRCIYMVMESWLLPLSPDAWEAACLCMYVRVFNVAAGLKGMPCHVLARALL